MASSKPTSIKPPGGAALSRARRHDGPAPSGQRIFDDQSMGSSDHLALWAKAAIGPVGSAARPVYLVDDDRSVRESIEFLLATVGVTCRSFEDGGEFLAEIAELPDGCVLIDQVMPQVGGLQVMHQLRQIGRTMPIILMTAATNASRRHLTEEIGPHALLEKPFDEDALCRALETSFERLGGGAEISAQHAVEQLSAQQVTVLRGLIAGIRTAGLARLLRLEETRVRQIRVALKERLGATDIHHAIAIGESAGLQPLRPDHEWKRN